MKRCRIEASNIYICTHTHHGHRNRGAGGAFAPPIFCQPKKFKIVKITTYRSVYRNMAKIC